MSVGFMFDSELLAREIRFMKEVSFMQTPSTPGPRFVEGGKILC